MKKFTTILFLIIPLISFSQNLENLDIKYGFNKFKLEGSLQTYIKDLQYSYTSTSNTNLKVYKYKKKDINVFGITDIKEIGLLFYKDKLYTIQIVFNLSSSSDKTYSTVLSKLVELFGTPTTTSYESTKYGPDDSRYYMENVNQWLTEKTLLGLNKEKCTSPVDPCTINVFLVSQRLRRQVNNDGF